MDFRELRKRAKRPGRPATAPPSTSSTTPGDDEPHDDAAAAAVALSNEPMAFFATEEPGAGPEAAAGAVAENDDAEWKSEMPDEVDAGVEILRLRLGRELFAIYLDEIEEIIKPKAFTWVPRTPPWILGLFSLRGTMIPVVDLRLRLGMPGTASETARVIVVTHNDEPCGLLVDEVRNVETIRSEAIEAIPAALQDAAGRFLHGLIRSEAREEDAGGGITHVRGTTDRARGDGNTRNELVALIDLSSVLALEGEGYGRAG